MQRPIVTAAAPIAAVLFIGGCGDSLLGAQGLAGLDSASTPEFPAWELRWFAGPDQGFVAPCELHPVAAADMDEEGLIFGYLSVFTPEVAQPAAIVEGPTYRYAVAIALLADRGSEGQTTRQSTSDLPLESIWGGAANDVLLWAEGDLDDLGDDLGIESQRNLVQGMQWTTLLAWDEPFTGDFEWTLRADSLNGDFWMYVDPWDALPSPVYDIASDTDVGGTAFEDCAR